MAANLDGANILIELDILQHLELLQNVFKSNFPSISMFIKIILNSTLITWLVSSSTLITSLLSSSQFSYYFICVFQNFQ